MSILTITNNIRLDVEFSFYNVMVILRNFQTWDFEFQIFILRTQTTTYEFDLQFFGSLNGQLKSKVHFVELLTITTKLTGTFFFSADISCKHRWWSGLSSQQVLIYEVYIGNTPLRNGNRASAEVSFFFLPSGRTSRYLFMDQVCVLDLFFFLLL